MGFALRDHTADAVVKADGENLGAVSAVVVDGLTAAMCNDPAETSDHFLFVIRTEGHEVPLFDYLDQLIYERDARGALPVAYEVTARLRGNEWVVEVSARGVPFANVDACDAKAVIYSEMRLAEIGAGQEAYIVFDV